MAFLAKCLICLLAAYGLAFYLAVPANPEVRFWQHVVELRDKEIAEVRTQNPDTPIIFFTGGSSCAFSIDPKIIEQECGLPAFNLGLPVAAGAKFILHQALERTQPGDILVICMEPDVLSNYDRSEHPSSFSFALSSASGKIREASGGTTFGLTPKISDFLNFSRPGSRHMVTYFAKLASGKGYRYTTSDMRYRGRLETPIKNNTMLPAGESTGTSLSEDGKELLKTVAATSNTSDVTVFYSMPWQLTTSRCIEGSRRNKKRLLDHIETALPTIRDGYAGVSENPDHFSDSPQHMTAEGSALRSKALASVLAKYLLRN